MRWSGSITSTISGHRCICWGGPCTAAICRNGSREVEFPADGYQGEYIKDIARAIKKEAGDTYLVDPAEDQYRRLGGRGRPDHPRVDQGRIWSGFGFVLIDGTASGIYTQGGWSTRLLDVLRGKGYLFEEQGACWFRSTLFGDEKDRVVIRGNEATTYFASDIAYHKEKYDRGYDLLIDIWGADHHGYIPRMEAVIQALGLDQSRFKVILVQLVNLLRGGNR